MGFRLEISEERRAKMDRIRREVDRLHELPDRFLARALLVMARRARKDAPVLLDSPGKSGYENLIVWSLIPRLAHCLGETALTKEERSAMSLAPDGGAALREYVGSCMNNQDLSRLGSKTGSEALEILGHSFVNGNPITSALDRIAPPEPESRDWVARHMREISRARFGDERFNRWEPEFQNYRNLVSMEEIFSGPDIDIEAVCRSLEDTDSLNM